MLATIAPCVPVILLLLHGSQGKALIYTLLLQLLELTHFITSTEYFQIKVIGVGRFRILGGGGGGGGGGQGGGGKGGAKFPAGT